MSKKIAVFIDAENTSFENINFVFEKLADFGEVVIKKAYADWSNQSLISYKSVLLEFAIQAVHEFSYVSKKNSSDILMAVDIMEILFTKPNIDIFVIVSSDSDFSSVCRKIIDRDKVVIGFGKSQTLGILQNTCTKFITFQKKETRVTKERDFTNPNELILKAVDEIIKENSLFDWFPTTKLINLLNKKIENFDIKDYGFIKFTSFLKSLDLFEIKNSSQNSLIRIKRIKNES